MFRPGLALSKRCYSTASKRPVIYQKKPFYKKTSFIVTAGILGYYAWTCASDVRAPPLPEENPEHGDPGLRVREMSTKDLYKRYIASQMLSSPYMIGGVSSLIGISDWVASRLSESLARPLKSVSSCLVHFLIGDMYVVQDNIGQLPVEDLRKRACGASLILSSMDGPEWDRDLEQEVRNLSSQYSTVDAKSEPKFVALNMTSLINPLLLKAGTESLLSTTNLNSSDLFPASVVLSQEEVTELEDLKNRLIDLCHLARDSGVKVIINAEKSIYQPAIDRITSFVEAQVNKPDRKSGSSGLFSSLSKSNSHDTMNNNIIVYRTIQTYLENAPDKLQRALQEAKDGNYGLGIQLVRGDSVSWELRRYFRDASYQPHSALASTCTIQEVKGNTDACYNKCAGDLLNTLDAAASGKRPAVSVMFSTQNWVSIANVLDKLEGYSYTGKNATLMFAQYIGVRDDITRVLVDKAKNNTTQAPFYVLQNAPMIKSSQVGDFFVSQEQYLVGEIAQHQETSWNTHDDRVILAHEIKRRWLGDKGK